ncbi:MAG: TonB-dependent receptor [Muribaculaceae bacterium]|nr:TonB-dependent receptor [Muribaculaceae bacterium]
MELLKSLIIFCCLIVTSKAFAIDYQVKGTVVDSLGEGEMYATIRIFNDIDSIKPILVGVTDEKGFFSQSLKTAGNYQLKIHSTGKSELSKDFVINASKPVVDMGTLTIKDNAEVLSEVTVMAQRPLITKEIDRIGYDVQADADSKTATIIEMLRKVPMVSVDAQNNITVKGSSNFKVYKNGRPNTSFSNNPKEVLSAIPASMIKRIEVITEPGAKYDAEGVGAILNIVTNDDTTIKGIMGNVSAQITTLGTPQGSVWLTSQIDKVAISAYAGTYNMNKLSSEDETYTHYDYKDSGSSMDYISKGTYNGWGTWFGADASWEPDTLNLFIISFNGYWHDLDVPGTTSTQMTAADGTPIYSYNAKYHYPQSYLDFTGNVSYQRSTHRKGETFNISYLVSTTDQNQDQTQEFYDMVNMPVAYTGTHSLFNLNFIEHTIQADYTRPFAKYHTIDVGAKYILRDNHSTTTNQYLGVDTTFSDFSHLTQVLAGYGEYRFKWKSLSAKAGIRYEYSHLNAKFNDGSQPNFSKNLNDWVPSAALSWQVNDANSLTFNYASRINRPGISYLNPAVEEHVNSTNQGNPNLSSARHNSMKLTYMLIRPKFNLNLSANYEFSNNGIVSYVTATDNHIYFTYANVGRNNSLFFDANIQWSITPTTQLNLYGSTYRMEYEIKEQGLRQARWQWGASARLTQQLPWKLRLEIAGGRNSGNVNNVYSYTENITNDGWNYYLSLQRSFLKENRLTVSIFALNPIGSSSQLSRQYFVNGDYTGYSNTKMMNTGKLAMLRVAYRFGSVNAQVKKTSKSISNDDIIGRKL